MSWQNLIDGNPELAAYGAARFDDRVGYLATVRKDGSPQVNPVSPLLHQNRLFVFMYPTSPKAHNLQRDGRYTLHCAVENRDGGEGEFFVRGTAQQTHEMADWMLVRPEHPEEFGTKYILFEFSVDFAFSMTYTDDQTVQNRWKRTGN